MKNALGKNCTEQKIQIKLIVSLIIRKYYNIWIIFFFCKTLLLSHGVGVVVVFVVVDPIVVVC